MSYSGSNSILYLDHAATSWPKPPEVLRAMVHFAQECGGNPGRSGHRMSIDSGRVVYNTRELVAGFFGAADPSRVIFTHNATHALNIALHGILRPGDTVVTTSTEHNSVMRPLRILEKRGVNLVIVPCAANGEIDIEQYHSALRLSPRLVVLAHAGNVIGRIHPVSEIARAAHEYGAAVMLDTAQTAGIIPVDIKLLGVDLLAFTGHKGLQGPTGTGGLVISDTFDPSIITPVFAGGTGSSSGHEEQPDQLPDRLESGTLNAMGIAGLGAAIEWINAMGLNNIREHHKCLIARLINGLAAIPGAILYGPKQGEDRAPLVSFDIAGFSVSRMGLRLDDEFAILCRVGLHCSPAAHRTIGTYPDGAVRFSIGPTTSEDDMNCALEAVAKIAHQGIK